MYLQKTKNPNALAFDETKIKGVEYHSEIDAITLIDKVAPTAYMRMDDVGEPISLYPMELSDEGKQIEAKNIRTIKSARTKSNKDILKRKEGK